ncbi:conserved hypothetical protein [Candidatus Desulfosporosinus infrequens]|uniref:DUF58 domain-containing protein n=1 Tax=Candidatus Desulfosporosinus infrequens TaxID=2043169 RepID=A0A2U3KUD6_9FIRM|nr:conserved hypothetical protein [Candidatus Desulfosporosinus infrequens]
MAELLFEKEFLKKLETMAFLLKKARAGRYSGLHRSTRKGQSVEFADYRAYVAGDDFRQVDWNAYARLDRLFIKLFMEENDLSIHLLLDTSASMAWEGSLKYPLAKQLVGALGYLALVNMEQVGVIALKQGTSRVLPLQRGRNATSRLWGFLSQLEAGGETDLNISLRQTGKYIKRPGIAIILSDMLSPSGYQEGLKYLQHLGQQVVVLHILAPEERDPQLLGNFRLVDCETGLEKEVSITPILLKAYKDHLETFIGSCKQFCLSREITYHLVGSEESLEDILLRSLRGAEVLV